MRYPSSIPSLARSLLAAALSLLLLTSCSSRLTKPSTPAQEAAALAALAPAASIPAPAAPARLKPLDDMQPLATPPAPPAISTLPPAQQGPAMLETYRSIIKALGECRATRDDLIRWVTATP